ncbi:hypothetical protein B0A49_00989 [Cryomyces minteri]|uniref:2EXR domain-containing protein n=1 Tax=Cryomyces minteri TaxID=331657 RepID=A0A4U0XWH8_9PEZI|nr:hypothetical protein B0A49_00989 [Cryomyces minteri]
MEHSPFSALASEIRNVIYELALHEPEPILLAEDTTTHEQPALTKVCRQIREECLAMHYHLNTFRTVISVAKFGFISDWLTRIGPSNCALLRSLQIGFNGVPPKDRSDHPKLGKIHERETMRIIVTQSLQELRTGIVSFSAVSAEGVWINIDVLQSKASTALSLLGPVSFDKKTPFREPIPDSDARKPARLMWSEASTRPVRELAEMANGRREQRLSEQVLREVIDGTEEYFDTVVETLDYLLHPNDQLDLEKRQKLNRSALRLLFG